MSVTSTATTRRTIQLPIDDGVVGLRGLSPQRHRFELEYALERGSTANSVLSVSYTHLTLPTKRIV